MKKAQYIQGNPLKQEQLQRSLDRLIEMYDGIPVGTGYIDIILLRDRYQAFIQALTHINLAVEAVSWWCRVTEEHAAQYGCPHGYGGPKTQFGWFSKLCHDVDEVVDASVLQALDRQFTSEAIQHINEAALALIQHKQTMPYLEHTLFFRTHPCLTPGIWVYVPDEWTRD
jgi:hypothetical protein